MGVTVKSPVERWAGDVVFVDPLLIEHVIAIENALDAAAESKDSAFLSALSNASDGKVIMQWTSRQDALYIPVIKLCLESHSLPLDFDKFPASPRKDSHALVIFLWSELLKIYRGVNEVPNA